MASLTTTVDMKLKLTFGGIHIPWWRIRLVGLFARMLRVPVVVFTDTKLRETDVHAN